MTAGQQLALRQLRSVQLARPGGLEILSVSEPVAPGKPLAVEISLDCAGVPHDEGGIRLRARERLLLSIPARFPLRKPSVWTPHFRWRGTPHVQWGDYVCLYASEATEWHPADGIFGLLERLWEWLQAAALGQLDPDGVALHPPVAYESPNTPLVIPRADAPAVGAEPWLGWAHAEALGDRRLDLTGWTAFIVDGNRQEAPANGAPAVLLPTGLDWEYPGRAVELFVALIDRGVDWGDLWSLLEFSALSRPGEPLLFVIGTAMRRLAGGESRQHLTAWRIPAETAGDMWKSLGRHTDREDLREFGVEARERVMEWAKKAPTEWCAVREARAEVTVRRDQGSPLRCFDGKTVALWGCGAIGSLIGEWLTRAGIRRLILRDSAAVAPGVLVRQNFVDSDLGYAKAAVLAARLKSIRPQLIVEAHGGNVLDGPLAGGGTWHEDADLVIDATASQTVTTAIETAFRLDNARPVATLLFGHSAEHGLAVYCPGGGGGGPLHALRAAKLACSNEKGLRRFADEFWPDPARSELFQPEPGCSDPTFTGSAVETAAVAATLLRSIARQFGNAGGELAAELLALDGADQQPATQQHISFAPPWVINLPGALQLRVNPLVLEQMRAEVVSSKGLRGAESETGGLLFGERDEAASLLWVDEATGPPSDSRHSPDEFLCGIKGVPRMVRARRRRGRGSLELLGTWHTHPVSPANPSGKDLIGMSQLLDAADSPLAQALLLIVGQSARTRLSMGAYLFERAHLRADEFRFSGRQRRLSKDVWAPLR